MTQPYDPTKPPVALEHDGTLVVVIEMSQASWLVAAIVPGVARRPLQKLKPDQEALLRLLTRWREEAAEAGKPVTRTALAFEAGRDGFWLARWLRARGVEAHVIHANSVAVAREHNRAKTDRLDTILLLRAFLGWLRGEPAHCRMAAIPSLADEDDKRPSREREHLVGERTRLVNRLKAVLVRLGIRGFKPTLRKAAGRLDALRTPDGEPIPPNTLSEMRRDLERLRLVREQIAAIEAARLERLARAPATGPDAMVRLLARVHGLGIETADMLVREVLARDLRDRRAVARYAGLTGTPDESGRRRREKGLSKAGNARVRRGMIQLAWRFLLFQKDSALAQWYRSRTESARGGVRKVLIVALARKLLVELWRLVVAGQVPRGVLLRPA
jgi:transposase